MDLPTEIVRRGGLARTRELLRAGATSHQLTRAVRVGHVVRVRQGWYGMPDADGILEAAVRVGGRATCVTAVAAHGLWAFASSTIHVRVPAHHSRLRRPDDALRRRTVDDDVVVHWRRGGTGTRHLMGVEDALRDMIGCQKPERIVAAADSALRAGHITFARWTRLIETAPLHLRRQLRRVDPASGSIVESILRFRLEVLGFVPASQVSIPGVGRVDFLLGRRLVIEVDGWETHGSRDAFEEDRRRDAELVRRGYVVLRFSARRVLRSWHAVLATIRDCVARGCTA